MTMPKAYDPQPDCKYQILVMCPNDREYEHLDYAVNKKDLNYLLTNYRQVYGPGYGFKTILLPRKYHPKKERVAHA